LRSPFVLNGAQEAVADELKHLWSYLTAGISDASW
jgi:hypothetical protein